MHQNRVRKYMAVVLSMVMVLGTISVPNGMRVRAAEDKTETKGLDLELPTGGIEETGIYLVEDREAAKVPSLDGVRRMVRSTGEETIFDQGTGDYGYKSLSQPQQTLYVRISGALQAFEEGSGEYTQISLSETEETYVPFSSEFGDLGLNQDQASQVWIAFGADHPWLFWLENGCAVSSDQLMPIVRQDYWGTANAMVQKRAEVKAKIQQEVKEYLKVADYYTLCYDKVREMDEMIIQAVDFAYQTDTVIPEEADWAHTIEGVFGGEHKAVVSEGYAKSFAFLLNILDIPNVYVTGKVSREGQTESHAWNCVSFDNGETYYSMDLTWDDQGTDNTISGNSYLYFAMPKSKFEQKHTANTSDGTGSDWLYDLPELGDDMYYTYFMQYGAYGTMSEVFAEDDARGFLSQVKAVAPNRLNTYAMMLDNIALSSIMKVMGLSDMKFINAEEYDKRIWANSLQEYSKGQSHPLFNLDTKSLTIDLDSETEKTLGIASAVNADGNYVRWHSDNNQVAVVKMPIYTKMEQGASVQIVAKKPGTATIRAEGSAGAMTCTVTVTGSTPSPKPTVTPKPTVNPTSSPSPTPSASEKPGTSPVPSASPEVSEKPGTSPVPSVSPEVSEKPGTSPVPSVSPEVSEKPGTSPVPSASPEVSEKPGTSPVPSASPEVSEKPGTSPVPSVSPEVSEKPGTSPVPSVSPEVSEKPGISASPVPSENSGIGKEPSFSVSPAPPKTPAKAEIKIGKQYRDKKTKAVYRVTGTGKTKTVAYQRSASKNAKKVRVPSSITIQGKKYRVTSIGNRAFADNKKLREVSLGKSVRSIGKKAFYGCKKLEKVEIGKNVTVIKENAFRKCTSLTLVIIPSKVKKIGDNAFRDCKNLQYIGVESNSLQMRNVGKNAFAGGYRNPRVKTAEKVWRKYSDIFVLRGLSDKGIFVIDPVKLII